MKAVVISIQPVWCEKIAAGEKTDEIRKNRPKLQAPFKCYIYQTMMMWSYPILRALGLIELVDKLGIGKGKVIGEFVCDKIEQIDVNNGKEISKTSCVSLQEMWKYAGTKSMYDLKAWHISKLVIYDNPKPLSEFAKPYGTIIKAFDSPYIQRPPQSWCYAEELKAGKLIAATEKGESNNMNGIREKLIKLLYSSPCESELEGQPGSCQYRKNGECYQVNRLDYCAVQKIADHLIENGVTIQESKEKRQTDLTGKCGSCEFAKPASGAFGNSACYISCTNPEHLRRYYNRPISQYKQRTTKACKKYRPQNTESI